MGLRDFLNQRPALTTGITLGVIVLAVGFVLWRVLGSEVSPDATLVTKAYFTDDDGASWFVDELSKVPPFQRNGKTAVGVQMFTCDGGKTLFVGWLKRFTPEGKRKREEMLARAKNQPAAIFVDAEDFSAAEVKKPRTAETGWVKETDPSADAVRAVTCPDGSTENLEPAPPPR